MSQQYDADVIVVGSGALGSNAATTLARMGKVVIILEAGEKNLCCKIVENFRKTPKKTTTIRRTRTSPGRTTLTTNSILKIPTRSSFAPAC